MTKVALVGSSAIAFAAIILACASTPPSKSTAADIVVPAVDASFDAGEPHIADARERYDEAMGLLNEERWDDATIAFTFLKEHYTYSRYAALAALRIADIAFGLKDYEAAAGLYEKWARDHPHDSNVAEKARDRAKFARCQISGTGRPCGSDTYDGGL